MIYDVAVTPGGELIVAVGNALYRQDERGSLDLLVERADPGSTIERVEIDHFSGDVYGWGYWSAEGMSGQLMYRLVGEDGWSRYSAVGGECWFSFLGFDALGHRALSTSCNLQRLGVESGTDASWELRNELNEDGRPRWTFSTALARDGETHLLATFHEPGVIAGQTFGARSSFLVSLSTGSGDLLRAEETAYQERPQALIGVGIDGGRWIVREAGDHSTIECVSATGEVAWQRGFPRGASPGQSGQDFDDRGRAAVATTDGSRAASIVVYERDGEVRHYPVLGAGSAAGISAIALSESEIIVGGRVTGQAVIAGQDIEHEGGFIARIRTRP